MTPHRPIPLSIKPEFAYPEVQAEMLADAGLPFRVIAEHAKHDQVEWLISSPRWPAQPTHDPSRVY